MFGANGKPATKAISDFLPHGAYISQREDVVGIDNDNFAHYAALFVVQVKNLTSKRKKSVTNLGRISVTPVVPRAADVSERGSNCVALPAHTSRKTQSLDFGVFPFFKHHLNDIIIRTSRTDAAAQYDIFDFTKMMSEAYNRSFTSLNIKAGLGKSDIWPMDPLVSVKPGMPVSRDDTPTLFTLSKR